MERAWAQVLATVAVFVVLVVSAYAAPSPCSHSDGMWAESALPCRCHGSLFCNSTHPFCYMESSYPKRFSCREESTALLSYAFVRTGAGCPGGLDSVIKSKADCMSIKKLHADFMNIDDWWADLQPPTWLTNPPPGCFFTGPERWLNGRNLNERRIVFNNNISATPSNNSIQVSSICGTAMSCGMKMEGDVFLRQDCNSVLTTVVKAGKILRITSIGGRWAIRGDKTHRLFAVYGRLEAFHVQLMHGHTGWSRELRDIILAEQSKNGENDNDGDGIPDDIDIDDDEDCINDQFDINPEDHDNDGIDDSEDDDDDADSIWDEFDPLIYNKENKGNASTCFDGAGIYYPFEQFRQFNYKDQELIDFYWFYQFHQFYGGKVNLFWGGAVLLIPGKECLNHKCVRGGVTNKGSALFKQVHFVENSAGMGGAVALWLFTDATFVECEFTGNIASVGHGKDGGGAIGANHYEGNSFNDRPPSFSENVINTNLVTLINMGSENFKTTTDTLNNHTVMGRFETCSSFFDGGGFGDQICSAAGGFPNRSVCSQLPTYVDAGYGIACFSPNPAIVAIESKDQVCMDGDGTHTTMADCPRAGFELRIRGTDLNQTGGAEASVMVGTVLCAPVLEWTPGLIRCILGANLDGGVDLLVVVSTNNGRTTASTPFYVSYQSDSVPQLYSMNVDPPGACEDSTRFSVHLQKCRTTGARLIITGLYFEEFDAAAGSDVRVGIDRCAVVSWTAQKIVCDVAAGVGHDLVVNITTRNGTSCSQDIPKRWSFQSPSLERATPDTGPVQGNVMTTFTGSAFGPPGTDAILTIGGALFTNVQVVNDQTVRGVTPNMPLLSNFSYPVVITVGDQSSGIDSAPIYNYQKPLLKHIYPIPGTVNGNVVTYFFGEHFGAPDTGVDVEVYFADKKIVCADARILNDTHVVARTVQYKGGISEAGSTSQNISVEIHIGSEPVHVVQSPTAKYSFKKPVIDFLGRIPNSGGDLEIFGSEFADLEGNLFEVFIKNKMTDIEATCSLHNGGFVEWVNSGHVRCTSVQGAITGCSTSLFVSVEVAGVRSNELPLCYGNDGKIRVLDDANNTLAEKRVAEDSDFVYDIDLSHEITQNTDPAVTLNISVEPSDICTLSHSTLYFDKMNHPHNMPQQVMVTVGGDDRDNDDIIDRQDLYGTCLLKHTVESVDPAYSNTLPKILTVFVIDDDVSGARLRPTRRTSLTNTSKYVLQDYFVHFLGPLTLVEGSSDTYGVQLLSRPWKDVKVHIEVQSPRPSTPARLAINSGSPSVLEFRPNNWNSTQVKYVTVESKQDDVDSKYNTEDFTLVHWIQTDDEVFSRKSENLTVVIRVEDDDSAGIHFASRNDAIIELAEGDEKGTNFTIIGLTSRPLSDVTLQMTSSLPDLITINPASIFLAAEKWNCSFANVTVQAKEGNYNRKTSATVYVTPLSNDSKYNSENARGQLAVAVALISCGAGEVNAKENSGKKCKECLEGQYSGNDDTVCHMCPEGWKQGGNGSATCSECIPGKYQPQRGQKACFPCDSGKFQAQSGKTSCIAVEAGSIVNLDGTEGTDQPSVGATGKRSINPGWKATGCNAQGKLCTGQEICPAGKRGASPVPSNACIPCLAGRTSSPGMTQCEPCSPGRYAPTNASEKCLNCDVSLGLYTAQSGQTACRKCGEEEVSTGQKCSAITEDPNLQVPAEVVLRLVQVSGHDDASLDGSTGESSRVRRRAANNSTTIESIGILWKLVPGAKGNSSPTFFQIYLSTDSDFLRGRYVFSNVVGPRQARVTLPPALSSLSNVVVYAKVRSMGPASDGFGSPWSGTSKPWTTADTCGDFRYLETNPRGGIDATNPHNWQCEPCPPGASCDGAITWQNVVAKFGFARCPHDPRHFQPCSFPAACLGGPNREISKKYEASSIHICNGSALSACEEKCNVAYVPGSLLCHSCAEGYSHSDLSGKCDKCPAEGTNLALTVVGIFVGIIGVITFVALTLSDAGSVKAGSVKAAAGIQTIGLSYIQMISLLTTFPIEWPAVMTAIFQVGGTVTVLGQHLVNLKCLFPKNSDADVFFAQNTIWAIMPLGLTFACVSVWAVLSKLRYVDSLRAKIRASCVAVLYLIYPTLCSQAFSIFSCRPVCEGVDHTYLRADLSVQCYKGIHAGFVGFVGVPMLIGYIIGFPLAAAVLVLRLKRRAILKNKHLPMMKGHLTFGLFYSSFREDVWWWETTGVLRKAGLAFVGVFGGSLGLMQVHLSMLFLLIITLLTALVQPFRGSFGKLLLWLELLALSATWLTLWAGSVFNTYPKCEDSNGKSLVWCEIMAVLVGMWDLLCAVLIACMYICVKRGGCRKWKLPKVTDEQQSGAFEVEMPEICHVQNPSYGTREESEAENINTSTSVTIGNEEWNRHLDEDSGKFYLASKTTGEVKWEDPEINCGGLNYNNPMKKEMKCRNIDPPSSLSPAPICHRRRSTQLPRNWDKYRDEEGRRYYVNGETQESQWKPPEGATGGSADAEWNEEDRAIEFG